MGHVSLSQLAKELGVNKSKLLYYSSLGLLKPVLRIGKMQIFDSKETLRTIKNIGSLKNKGLTLKEIKVK